MHLLHKKTFLKQIASEMLSLHNPGTDSDYTSWSWGGFRLDALVQSYDEVTANS